MAPKQRSVWSIISLPEFIQATRDSGYKGTVSAISELIDNSLQAGAKHVEVRIEQNGENAWPLSVCVQDDGCGMTPRELRQALRFGGSTRFDDRHGLGRYGMGLPNASLSQARCVTVYSWRLGCGRGSATTSRGDVHATHLDVDEIASGAMHEVPPAARPRAVPTTCGGSSGTLVVWSKCDRLDLRKPETLQRRLSPILGRKFRYFIWNGVSISINGKPLQPIDPLGEHADSPLSGAKPFGKPFVYSVKVPESGVVGKVIVRFSELPVAKSLSLSNDEKRRIGISNGAGVSIVRAGREVDYGWFLMGNKRRENYDDWWRCEVQFDPVLDELFGISHTKQQVRPTQTILDAIGDDIEATARALNARVRRAHLAARTADQFSESERLASSRDHLLPPLPKHPAKNAATLMHEIERQLPRLRDNEARSKYRIAELSMRESVFFSYAHDGRRLVLLLNPDHPFHSKIYRPLAESEATQDKEVRVKLELILLAAARAEAARGRAVSGRLAAEHRATWSRALAAFLDG
jgi:Histidine kinase-, DNA gyrase B-, and HSP90-like ATPase